MNRLEHYIRDNKSLFDEEPEAGHFERLQQKMNHRRSRRTAALSWTVSIAASIAILLFVGILREQAGKPDHSMILCENSIDMKSCYLSKMNAVAGQIEMLTKNLDSWGKHQVMTDVKNIMAGANSDFESEIPEELPANQAKIILSDYYRQNLESLERIKSKLRMEN